MYRLVWMYQAWVKGPWGQALPEVVFIKVLSSRYAYMYIHFWFLVNTHGPFSSLKVKIIEEAHRLLPCAEWWIKADGVDLISSLEESVKLEWNGDIDTGDGYTQELYKEYRQRLKSIKTLDVALGTMETVRECIPGLQSAEQDISKDLDFIDTSKSEKCYSNYPCIVS